MILPQSIAGCILKMVDKRTFNLLLFCPEQTLFSPTLDNPSAQEDIRTYFSWKKWPGVETATTLDTAQWTNCVLNDCTAMENHPFLDVFPPKLNFHCRGLIHNEDRHLHPQCLILNSPFHMVQNQFIITIFWMVKSTHSKVQSHHV